MKSDTVSFRFLVEFEKYDEKRVYATRDLTDLFPMPAAFIRFPVYSLNCTLRGTNNNVFIGWKCRRVLFS